MRFDGRIRRREALKTITAGLALTTSGITLGTRTASAAGGTSTWLTEGGDPGQAGVGDVGPTSVTSSWRYSEVGDGQPLVLDDLVVFDDNTSGRTGDFDFLIGVDRATGTPVFSLAEVGGTDTPAAADGLVVTGEGPLTAVDTSFGTVRWTNSDVSDPTTSPTIQNGAVYIGTRQPDELVSVMTDNGVERWRQPLPGDIFASPAVVNGQVIVTTSDGSVSAFATSDGTLVWQTSLGTDTPIRPTVTDGVVYTGEGDTVFALDATDGSVRWQSQVGTLDSKGVAVDGTRVYLCVDAGEFGGAPDDIFALDAGTGSVAWTTQVDATLSAPPTVADGTLYVGGSNTVYVLDAANGSVVSTQFTDDMTGTVIPNGPAIAGGQLFVRNDDVFAYEPDRSGVSATTGTATNVGAGTATFVGELTDLGAADSADVFFEYEGRRTERITLTSTGQVSVTVDDLRSNSNVTYQFVAAGAGGTTDTGSQRSVSTQAADGELVTVRTDRLESVTETTATFSGSLINNDNVDSVDVGFEFGPAGGSLDSFVSAGSLSTAVGFDASVSGLDPATTYEFRAVADGATDADTGSAASFSTLIDSAEDPVVDSLGVSTKNNGPWTRATLDWAVSDADGDLSSVLAELVASDGTVTDAVSTAVSGSSATGQSSLESKNGGSTARLTVTDAAGNETVVTRTV